MLSIFKFSDYREFLHAWLESQQSNGHGVKLQIASALGISSSLVSQIFKGNKSFTADQASRLCDFIGFSDLESDYLHLLVEYDRAVTSDYRGKLSKKIKLLQNKSLKIRSRVPRDHELTEVEKAIYYSSWVFTAIRNLSAVDSYDQPAQIASRLQLEHQVVIKAVRFLVENGLCREQNGRLTYGPAAIHVDKDSPFVNKHHQNWRFQALQKMDRRRSEDIFFTGPMSLSHEALKEIRSLIPEVIQRVMKISGPSKSQTTACLSIDWFEF